MQELSLIMPEVFLALTLAFVIIGEITYHGERTRLVTATALLGLGSAFIQTLITHQQWAPSQAFHGTLSIDGISLFFRLLFITLASLSIISASHAQEIPRKKRAEYTALVLAATLGMSFAASSADLLLAFLSLQFANISAYFLSGYSKRAPSSNEAAVKYLVFSVVAGALMVYGFALLMGSTQVLNIYEMHSVLAENPLPRVVGLVVFMLLLAGLTFQIGAFPMYFWAPDVLEGAPTPASGFLAAGSRAAGFAVALRFLLVLFAKPAAEQPGHWEVMGALDWPQIIALISAMTMLVGSLLAFRQKAMKRMVAALIVAQTGYLLMGLLVLQRRALSASLYSLVIEMFAILGIFYVIAFFHDHLRSDRLSQLRGVFRQAVPESICLVLFLATLVGLPPMPGFLAKFTLIGAALSQRWMALAMVAVFAMALSAATLARFAAALIGEFRASSSTPLGGEPTRHLFLLALLIPLLLAGVFAEQVLAWTVKSAELILW